LLARRPNYLFASVMGAGNGAQANFLMGEPAFRSLVPQVRVPTLDANLGSLTLTTGITSSLDPAIYNASGWAGGPGYHPLPHPQGLPHERSSCAWVGHPSYLGPVPNGMGFPQVG